MAVPYYGDFAEDDTVNIPFNTFSSNDPSASITITDLANADIKVHKDAHIDQIVTDGATVVINFDGITGNHYISIDTSVDAAYATGSEYAVRIEGTDIDGGIVNAWVGAFSIERAGGALAILKTLTIANGAVDAKVTYVMDTILAEGGVGRLAAGFNKLFDVAAPVLTAASVDQGADNNTILSSLTIADGAVDAKVTYLMDTILAEGGAGRLAAAFNKLFDVAVPTLVASSVMRGTDGANTTIPDAAGVVEAFIGANGANLTDLLTAVGFNVVVPDAAGVVEAFIGANGANLTDLLTAVGFNVVVPPSLAQFNARSIPSADYVVVGDTIAGVTLASTVTTNSDLVTAAAIKTALEADGGDLSSLMEALVNKLLITEANGNAEMHNDAGVSQGTVAAAFTSIAGVTQRKRILI